MGFHIIFIVTFWHWLFFLFFSALFLINILPHHLSPRPVSEQHLLWPFDLITMFLVLSATTELRDFFAKARNGSVRLIKVIIEEGKLHF